MDLLTPLFKVLALDVLFVGLLILLLLPIKFCNHAAFAVMKRNFVSYFSTPTGYVFLCLFVLLTSFAAFWPHDFFANNLATLDQLNLFLPNIMLIFIPAITMSIWSEERKQGTDELLLTIPAGDFDIVLGKYLAAATIFTSSLLFSQLSNFLVLNALSSGHVDIGLFFSTYLGYWLIGMAMLSVGMVASFLTSNLTVGFILGALFNAPLAFASSANVIIHNDSTAQFVSMWGALRHLEDFGRGVISLSSTVYFVSVICVGIYFSIVLIGSRHWWGGRDAPLLVAHYTLRIVSLLAIVVGSCVLFTNNDLIRYDISSQKISTISPSSRLRIDEISTPKLADDETSGARPVVVEAFISKDLPDAFVKVRYDILSLLRELKKHGGNKIELIIHKDMEPFSEEAQTAEDRYGIRPMTIATMSEGSPKRDDIFLAAAFSCGMERVVVPFFGQGTPVEYELVRSICTVAKVDDDKGKPKVQKRKKLGILRTNAKITGGFDLSGPQGPRNLPPQAIVADLRRQYEVEEVSADEPITPGTYDVLLVVQPSSLTPNQMTNLEEAILAGQATALFEDPAPMQIRVTPTDSPNQAAGGMMGMRQPPAPKGDFDAFLAKLGVRMVKGLHGTPSETPKRQNDQKLYSVDWKPFTTVVWQHYNPYPKDRNMPDAGVYADASAPGAEGTFASDVKAVSGFGQVLFLAPGAIEASPEADPAAKDFQITPLVQIGTNTGMMNLEQLRNSLNNLHPEVPVLVEAVASDQKAEEKDTEMGESLVKSQRYNDRLKTGERYAIAAQIKSANSAKAKKGDGKEKGSAPSNVNVILVADIDLLDTIFVNLRNQAYGSIQYNFENTAFALNVIDALAGDERFLEIRKRRTRYARLSLIERQFQAAEDEWEKVFEDYQKTMNTKKNEEVGEARQEEAERVG